MPIRDLLCVIEAAEKPSRTPLGQTLALAKGYRAAASVLVAGPKATAPYSMFGGAAVGDIVKSENAKITARAKALAAEAKAELAKSGGKGEVIVSFDAFQEMLARVTELALCHDLTVLERPGGAIEHSEVVFEEVLFSAGRPVLLPVPDAKPVGRIEKIALAWDGSPNAARALSAALALFDGIKQAEVIVVRGEKDLSGMVAAEKIAAHIGRHGIKAKAVELKVASKGVASTLDGHATKAGADLLVMGAFGRSRLREFVLGGVTRDLTRNSKRQLLLSH